MEMEMGFPIEDLGNDKGTPEKQCVSLKEGAYEKTNPQFHIVFYTTIFRTAVFCAHNYFTCTDN